MSMNSPAPNTQYRLSDILALFEDTDRYEPFTAKEVAEDLGCSRRTALNKLDDLQKRGEVDSKKVGARGRVWWRPEPARRSKEPMTPEEVKDRVEKIELPGEGEVLKERQKAVQQAYEYLRKERVAGASEISSAVYSETTGGYRNDEILWSKTLLPGLKQLPGLDTPEPGGKWRFMGEDPEGAVHTSFKDSNWTNELNGYVLGQHSSRVGAIEEARKVAKERGVEHRLRSKNGTLVYTALPEEL